MEGAWMKRYSQAIKDIKHDIVKEAKMNRKRIGERMVTHRQVLDTVALPLSTTPGSLSHKLLRLILSCDLSRWGFGVTSEWDIKKERRESGGRARPKCGRRLELRHAR